MGKTRSARIHTFGRSFPSQTPVTSKTSSSNGQRLAGEAAQGQVLVIDCKTVRRSADKANGESPIYMATANGVAL